MTSNIPFASVKTDTEDLIKKTFHKLGKLTTRVHSTMLYHIATGCLYLNRQGPIALRHCLSTALPKINIQLDTRTTTKQSPENSTANLNHTSSSTIPHKENIVNRKAHENDKKVAILLHIEYNSLDTIEREHKK